MLRYPSLLHAPDVLQQVQYYECGFRYFKENELHVDRILDQHVLLLMFDGELIFYENDNRVSLSRGDWYIQQPHKVQQGIEPSLLPRYFYLHYNGIDVVDDKGAPVIRGQYDPMEFTPYLDELWRLEQKYNRDPLGSTALVA